MPRRRPVAVEFEAFYGAELTGSVRRIALIVGSVPAAEDIVHDALVQVYRRWDHLDSPGAYLRTATLNGAFRWLGRQHREPAYADPPEAPAHVPSAFVEMVDQLAGLTPRQRAAVVLRYYVGLKEDEIAEVLSCRPGSVGPLLSRARAHLRREWADGPS